MHWLRASPACTCYAGPLSGTRVVDLTRALAGPYCTLLLGDMGADVVKIELPGSGDETRQWGPPFVAGESSYFMSVNRNKRSVTLDLKSEPGCEALRRLTERADVLVENFRPGTMERLGPGVRASAARSTRRWSICSVSGFGQTGPRARQPAYDAILQGMGGVQFLSGERTAGRRASACRSPTSAPACSPRTRSSRRCSGASATPSDAASWSTRRCWAARWRC